MRDVCFFLAMFLLAPLVALAQDGSYPVTIDLDDHAYRQVVVDHEAGQYLGHPTTCLLEDGKTMLCVYCLLYTSPSPRDQRGSRMPSSA